MWFENIIYGTSLDALLEGTECLIVGYNFQYYVLWLFLYISYLAVLYNIKKMNSLIIEPSSVYLLMILYLNL